MFMRHLSELAKSCCGLFCTTTFRKPWRFAPTIEAGRGQVQQGGLGVGLGTGVGVGVLLSRGLGRGVHVGVELTMPVGEAVGDDVLVAVGVVEEADINIKNACRSFCTLQVVPSFATKSTSIRVTVLMSAALPAVGMENTANPSLVVVAVCVLLVPSAQRTTAVAEASPIPTGF